MEVKNKFALITGGAHRIGKEISLSLARNGANIIIHYGKSKELAQETLKEVKECGVEVFKFQADLANLSEIDSLFNYIDDSINNIDILVNNAASFHKKPFLDITPGDWNQVMAINLRAPFFCTQKAAQIMKKNANTDREAGLIINIADLSAIHTWAGFSHHGISKAGLIQLTKASARELAPLIRVNAIIPGPILPPPYLDQESEKWLQIEKNIPLQKSGSPKNIGQTVNFLVKNDFITGSIIFVDGGENLVPRNH